MNQEHKKATIRTTVTVLTLLAASALSSNAEACGGLFCSAVNPVNQTAERIIFAQDDQGMITQIVEIMYEGPSERFAWVLPVVGSPEIGVSSVQAFDRLQAATNPTFRFNNRTVGKCGGGLFSPPAAGESARGDGDWSGDLGDVMVLDAGSAGPYDYETISVRSDLPDGEDPADVALEWLKDNDYDVGALGADVLRPYLENGLNLLAVRLQSGRSVGSIRPLSLKYEAPLFSIPIRPTAVAANDDMGILVWVLGAQRAVSTNYRGLEINELLIDWFNPGRTYDRVISVAANEAGGQGFVTEFAGAASQFSDTIYLGESAAGVRRGGVIDLQETLEQMSWSVAGLDGFMDVADKYIQLRAGTISQLFECPSCYFEPADSWIGEFRLAPADQGENGIPADDPIFDTDIEAFLDDVELEVVQPLRAVSELFSELDYVTRLYTTMSAEEMTADPIFEFNPDLEDVSNVHVAEREVHCDGSEWKATLSDGSIVYGESSIWPYDPDSESEAGVLLANARVLQFKSSGAPKVIVDNRGAIRTAHQSRAPSTPTRHFKGCSVGAVGNGFSRQGGMAWGALGLLLAWSLRRRRASR